MTVYKQGRSRSGITTHLRSLHETRESRQVVWLSHLVGSYPFKQFNFPQRLKSSHRLGTHYILPKQGHYHAQMDLHQELASLHSSWSAIDQQPPSRDSFCSQNYPDYHDFLLAVFAEVSHSDQDSPFRLLQEAEIDSF